MARKRKAKSRQDFKSTQPQATTSRIAPESGHNPESDDAPYQLWCLVEGDSTLFKVTSPSNIYIDGLKKLIHEQRKQGALQGALAKDLVLLKFDHPMPDDDYALSTLEFNDRRLSSQHPVLKYWPKPPPNGKIHVFVKNPAGLKRNRSLDDNREEDAKRRQQEDPRISLFSKIPRDVSRAEFMAKMKELYQANFVHGDIRDINILVRVDGDTNQCVFKIVDFELSGVAGEVQYPVGINTTSIERPPRVRDGVTIITEDDDFMETECVGLIVEASAK